MILPPDRPSRSIGDGCHVDCTHGTLALRTEDAEGHVTHRIFLKRAVLMRLIAYGVDAYDCRDALVAACAPIAPDEAP